MRPNLLVLLTAACPLAAGCVCSSGKTGPALVKATFGDLSSEKVDLVPYVALARALVAGEKGPSLPSSPGRRVFVTVYPDRGRRMVATGMGETLEASVLAAAGALPPLMDGGPIAFRVELDVVDKAEPMTLEDEFSSSWGDVGMSGFAATLDGTQIGYVLPTEIILDRDFEEGGSGKSTKLEAAKIWKAIDGRGGFDHSHASAFRIHTRAFVDSAKGPGAKELRRGAIATTSEATPENLLDAVRLGADYLSRALDANGRYNYRYRPTDDHNANGYGLLRHAGATYALLEAYDELKVPLYREKAEGALSYAEAQLKWIDDAGKRDAYLLDTNDEEQQKVGGAGIFLVALAKHMEVTGSRDHLETARALARFIVHEQYPDGHFRTNRDVESEGLAPDGATLKTELVYYPGEAILGLVRLFLIDPDPKWLAAAKKAVDYCIHIRDKDASVESLEHDHWLTYAMNDLYRIDVDQSYLEHADDIAHAILHRLRTGHDAPAQDFVGAFFNKAPTTPASTRLEALTTDIELARFTRRPEAWLMKAATAVAKFTRAQQLDPDRVYFAKDPAKARGGVRESLFVEDIRIDYVQHAMSGWLHLARELRDPAYSGWSREGTDAGTGDVTRRETVIDASGASE
jgi:hypothetical protein